MTPNAIFRLRARTALKNNWQIALLVVFIASLPSILTQVVSVLTGGDMSARLMTLMEDPSFLNADPDTMLGMMASALTGEGTTFYGLFSLLAWVVAPVLTLGLHHYMADLLRGQPGAVSSVFARMRCFFKALGLTLLTVVKVFLWSVPGMVIAIGGPTAAAAMGMQGDALLGMMMSAMSAGYVLMFALMIAAMLRYAMAPYVMAEAPETGILACLRRSKELMKRRKLQLMMLELSFIGWNLLVMLVYTLLTGLFGYVIALTVQMFLNLFVAAYQHCSITAFFLQYQEGGEPHPAEILPEELADEKQDDPWHRSDD